MHKRVIHQRTLQVVRATNIGTITNANIITLCGRTNAEHHRSNSSTDSPSFHCRAVVRTHFAGTFCVYRSAHTATAYECAVAHTNERNDTISVVFTNVGSADTDTNTGSDAIVPKLCVFSHSPLSSVRACMCVCARACVCVCVRVCVCACVSVLNCSF